MKAKISFIELTDENFESNVASPRRCTEASLMRFSGSFSEGASAPDIAQAGLRLLL
jgi:hypothetical protein